MWEWRSLGFIIAFEQLQVILSDLVDVIRFANNMSLE
jgi:hypothetical protein